MAELRPAWSRYGQKQTDDPRGSRPAAADCRDPSFNTSGNHGKTKARCVRMPKACSSVRRPPGRMPRLNQSDLGTDMPHCGMPTSHRRGFRAGGLLAAITAQGLDRPENLDPTSAAVIEIFPNHQAVHGPRLAIQFVGGGSPALRHGFSRG